MPGAPENFMPVYLFTGFLEAGKTQFIRQTLNDPRFNTGENTLVLLCEEGSRQRPPTAQIFLPQGPDRS